MQMKGRVLEGTLFSLVSQELASKEESHVKTWERHTYLQEKLTRQKAQATQEALIQNRLSLFKPQQGDRGHKGNKSETETRWGKMKSWKNEDTYSPGGVYKDFGFIQRHTVSTSEQNSNIPIHDFEGLENTLRKGVEGWRRSLQCPRLKSQGDLEGNTTSSEKWLESE